MSVHCSERVNKTCHAHTLGQYSFNGGYTILAETAAQLWKLTLEILISIGNEATVTFRQVDV